MQIINAIINNAFLLITFGFMGLYLVSLVLNLFRATKVLKIIKQNPNRIKATVVEITEEKKFVYVKVKYTSLVNHQIFTDVFQFTKNEFKDQYYLDQEVEIIYPNVTSLKKIYYFPKFLEGQKVKIEMGPLFTDILLALSGIFIFAYVLYQMIIKTGSFAGLLPLASGGIFQTTTTAEQTGIFSTFAILIVMVIYVILFNYVLERLIQASVEHTHSYLKLCGIQCTAKVVTYKFGRSKDAKGNKEAQMKIEFYDNGDLVQANLNSYLYTETQDEYIKILYDEKNPKTTVYMR